MKTHLLVDGDIVIYRIASAAEVWCDWGDDVWTTHTDHRKSCEFLDVHLTQLREETKADKVTVCLSGDSTKNWRLGVMPDYKASRAKQRKPFGYKKLLEYCLTTYSCLREDILEADDLLGVEATTPLKGWRKVISSDDKDLLSVPGYHWSGTGLFTTDEAMSDRFHLFQTLVGDQVDNYPGCPGIGKVKAEKLLEEQGATWETVVAAYVKALGEELGPVEALRNARVARILRCGEYDHRTGVRLWEPSSSC